MIDVLVFLLAVLTGLFWLASVVGGYLGTRRLSICHICHGPRRPGPVLVCRGCAHLLNRDDAHV